MYQRGKKILTHQKDEKGGGTKLGGNQASIGRENPTDKKERNQMWKKSVGQGVILRKDLG